MPRNLSEGITERIEIRLKYCGLLKDKFAIIGMYCLYVELRPRLSLELDSLSRLASEDECCDTLFMLPDLDLCDVELGSPAVTG